MSRIYDNWDRLVGATLRREELRRIAQRTPSELSSASSSFSLVFRGYLVGNSFTHDQILQATNSLSDSNLIKEGHSGDLYHGVLEDGSKAVIKKIDLSSLARTESHHRFASELEFMHKLSHFRLVPLWGHCLENANEKFLVYKYMAQKDLSRYLYKENVPGDGDRHRFSPLDWRTRLKIAVGTAEGLCYLHHECIPPIVHRDIKASSILLDENFEVRIGSLSEVYNVVESVAGGKRIAKFLRLYNGTGRGTKSELPIPVNATRAHDVYCFGKVLLQLVTGRLHVTFTAGDLPDLISPASLATNWKDLRHQIYDEGLVRSILDPSLATEEGRFVEVWAVAIVALACLNPKPTRRPQMAQVLRALKNPKISQSAYYEMTRIIEAHKTFLGPISPKFYN